MSYKPTSALGSDVRTELERVATAISQLEDTVIPFEAVPPAKPRLGMVRLCDGANWDPLNDGVSQLVWFDGTSWQALGSSGARRDKEWFLQC